MSGCFVSVKFIFLVLVATFIFNDLQVEGRNFRMYHPKIIFRFNDAVKAYNDGTKIVYHQPYETFNFQRENE
uniref:Uncharacterized protein n=1 Tax=Strongyloides papillosus TaxID=174720 RepID=A0A0N5CBZ8_STREA